tara:strand:- start:566 stop:1384 length:819 start_codon:yes stop_codon:yes gene_type:complete
MERKNTIEKEFKKNYLYCLKKININKNKNIYLVSNLKKIGRVKIPKNKKIKLILDGIEKVVGKNGTIFSPSASMNLVNSDVLFDLKNTPSYKMGPLAEMIRKKSKFRSLHPYWSICGYGKNANILNDVSNHSYAYGSPWSKFLDLDVLQVNIGIHPSKAVTLIHHIETIFGVPYRYTKEFSHKIKSKNKIVLKKFYMSVRYKNSDIEKKKKLNEHYFKILKKQNKLEEIKLISGIKIWAFKMRDFFDVSSNLFKKNLYNYLEKEPRSKPYAK